MAVTQDEYQYLIVCIGDSTISDLTYDEHGIYVRLMNELRSDPKKVIDTYNYIRHEYKGIISEGSIIDSICELCSPVGDVDDNILQSDKFNPYSFTYIHENEKSTRAIIRTPDSVEDFSNEEPWCKSGGITSDQYTFLRKSNIKEVRWSMHTPSGHISLNDSYIKVSSLPIISETNKEKCGKDVALLIVGIGLLSIISMSGIIKKARP